MLKVSDRFLAGDPQYRNYDIMPIISAFNLILAAYPNRSGGGGVMVGRNKFFMPGSGPSMPLGGGLEAVRGFYSSVRTAHNQLMVNVNGTPCPHLFGEANIKIVE